MFILPKNHKIHIIYNLARPTDRSRMAYVSPGTLNSWSVPRRRYYIVGIVSSSGLIFLFILVCEIYYKFQWNRAFTTVKLTTTPGQIGSRNHFFFLYFFLHKLSENRWDWFLGRSQLAQIQFLFTVPCNNTRTLKFNTPLRLTARKTLNFSWDLNFRVCVLLKSAVTVMTISDALCNFF